MRTAVEIGLVIAAMLLVGLGSTLFGTIVLVVPALLLALLLVRYAVAPRTAERLVLLCAALGGMIGVSSGIRALVEVSELPEYAPRAGFGWAAVGLAVIAALAGTQERTRPVAASIIMFASSTLGFVAINLFYINTFYVLAVLLFWAGALLALSTRRRTGTTEAI